MTAQMVMKTSGRVKEGEDGPRGKVPEEKLAEAQVLGIRLLKNLLCSSSTGDASDGQQVEVKENESWQETGSCRAALMSRRRWK